MPRETKRDEISTRTDGRALRSQRSRSKIVDALFELVGEGVMRPTALQVAERAEVGIRSVFRHFDDMDALFAEMNERLRGETRSALEVRRPGAPLASRMDDLVRVRCRFYERISPYWRAGEAHRSRSEFLAEEHHSAAPRLRENLLEWLPELADESSEITDALEMILSPESWQRLRAEQRLGVRRATRAMNQAALALCCDLLD